MATQNNSRLKNIKKYKTISIEENLYANKPIINDIDNIGNVKIDNTIADDQVLTYSNGNWVNMVIPSQIPPEQNLDSISDVNIVGPVLDNQVLTHSNGEWTNLKQTLSNCSDVSITTPVSGNILKYNGTGWINDSAFTSSPFGRVSLNCYNVSYYYDSIIRNTTITNSQRFTMCTWLGGIGGGANKQRVILHYLNGLHDSMLTIRLHINASSNIFSYSVSIRDFRGGALDDGSAMTPVEATFTFNLSTAIPKTNATFIAVCYDETQTNPTVTLYYKKRNDVNLTVLNSQTIVTTARFLVSGCYTSMWGATSGFNNTVEGMYAFYFDPVIYGVILNQTEINSLAGLTFSDTNKTLIRPNDIIERPGPDTHRPFLMYGSKS